MMEEMGLSRSTKWGGYQAHHVIPKQHASHPALKAIKYDIDEAANGIFLREVDKGVSAMARHQGNHNGYSKAVENALDKIDLKQSKDAIAKQVADIQDMAKKGMMNGTPIRAKDIWKGKSKVGNERALKMWNKILGVE
ncbi:AHH domain-containing protein [Xenorhabdus bovienii]|uniref:AHH domain-containing protein n=1 Tax=Xenorhabdus bovienii TaxID=40576 RepID=UPI003DA6C8A7